MTVTERNELVLNHISMANRIASYEFGRTPNCVQFDELQSAAYLGLVDAANKYDGSKPFEVYASFRIFGEIKDYLRSLSWAGRNKTIKVTSFDNEYDFAAEAEVIDEFEDTLDELAKNISSRKKQILNLYYNANLTIAKIADKLAISQTRVFQLLKEAIAELKAQWRTEDDFGGDCCKVA